VVNLVMNAIAAVADEPPEQRLVRVETRPADGGVEIVVSDRGLGVAPEDAARMFEPGFTTRKDGMGFGLSIVKTIVDLHQGRVRHEPNTPRGTVFRVWMPAGNAGVT
jgi:signal transduction histidine kinase